MRCIMSDNKVWIINNTYHSTIHDKTSPFYYDGECYETTPLLANEYGVKKGRVWYDNDITEHNAVFFNSEDKPELFL